MVRLVVCSALGGYHDLDGARFLNVLIWYQHGRVADWYDPEGTLAPSAFSI